eukprot:TRINITY_DN1177_c0_g2_i1.p1 TRINITY_DN1177_c0_g2~~TRINITY_DN1177_c0_g2_i1.p1  ORF type:complete len:183 (-),score=67.58 TRINITY_DN1177_c0_g2_i1:27-533(-)
MIRSFRLANSVRSRFAVARLSTAPAAHEERIYPLPPVDKDVATREAPEGAKFAVVHIKGHQYKVTEGDVVTVNKIDTADVGETLALDKVLMVGSADFTQLGAPLVADACVHAEILEQTRSDKIIVFKKKRRKGYERTNGHRQSVTTLLVRRIQEGSERGTDNASVEQD